jgi:diacylglycerol kinase (ATP)
MVMSRKILFFINPISGTRKKAGLEKKLLTRTSDAGFTGKIAYTNAEGDYSYLPAMIQDEGITDVVVCGGDGSVNQVGRFLLHSNTNIGIVPMGSGNGLAYTALIPRRIDKALDIIFQGNSSTIDGFKINDRFSCMLCGLGLDAQVAADFAAKGRRGLLNYIKESTINFFSAHCYPFEVNVGELKIETHAYFISVANSNQFGNNFKIAPKASLNDGLLDVVIVKKMNKLRLLWSVLKQVATGTVHNYEIEDHDKSDVIYFQAANVQISNKGLAPLHIDGDVATSSEFINIQVLPNALRLLQPVLGEN